MNQKKKMAIILASILALMLVGAAVASKIIASDPYRLPSVKHRPTETPVVTAEPTAELTAEPTAEPTEEPVVEPTRQAEISYAVFCLKKKNKWRLDSTRTDGTSERSVCL